MWAPKLASIHSTADRRTPGIEGLHSTVAFGLLDREAHRVLRGSLADHDDVGVSVSDGREDRRRGSLDSHHASPLHIDQRHIVNCGKPLHHDRPCSVLICLDVADHSAWNRHQSKVSRSVCCSEVSNEDLPVPGMLQQPAGVPKAFYMPVQKRIRASASTSEQTSEGHIRQAGRTNPSHWSVHSCKAPKAACDASVISHDQCWHMITSPQYQIAWWGAWCWDQAWGKLYQGRGGWRSCGWWWGCCTSWRAW